MKRLLFVISLLITAVSVSAQRPSVREEVLSDWNLASGLDAVYDFNVAPLTATPEGYEPFYISHYGRHGSRFAYTSSAYTTLLEMLRNGRATDNLTDFGVRILSELEPMWKKTEHRIGDLTQLGWKQQFGIAGAMVESFPPVFTGSSRIDACASSSPRSMMSMSAFCIALSKLNPRMDIYEHQGLYEIQATAPNLGVNPLRLKGPEFPPAYDESKGQFFLRRFPEYKDVLGRLFKDPSAALGSRSPLYALFDIYMLVGGMNSISEEYKMNLDGLFTPKEYARMWEVANYKGFSEYYKYRTSCCSIYDDIVSRADGRISSGETGADLRFGHDHVLMALMMICDIEGFGEISDSVDSLAEHFQTFRSPMGANLQFVFYRPVSGVGDILFKVLLNGEEARIGRMPYVSKPYYRWNDFKSYYASVRSRLVGDEPLKPEPEKVEAAK